MSDLKREITVMGRHLALAMRDALLEAESEPDAATSRLDRRMNLLFSRWLKRNGEEKVLEMLRAVVELMEKEVGGFAQISDSMVTNLREHAAEQTKGLSTEVEMLLNACDARAKTPLLMTLPTQFESHQQQGIRVAAALQRVGNDFTASTLMSAIAAIGESQYANALRRFIYVLSLTESLPTSATLGQLVHIGQQSYPQHSKFFLKDVVFLRNAHAHQSWTYQRIGKKITASNTNKKKTTTREFTLDQLEAVLVEMLTICAADYFAVMLHSSEALTKMRVMENSMRALKAILSNKEVSLSEVSQQMERDIQSYIARRQE